MLPLDDGRVAFGFTGVRDHGADQRFLQTICVATGPDAYSIDSMPKAAISCPLRDYDAIVGKGFYLGPHASLGSDLGEEGGPIMAWRDPFLFSDSAGDLQAIWSAKISPTRPAIAHARLKRDGKNVLLDELSSPIELPDADLMTQAEVPKLYRDPGSGDFLLMVSACDRRYEGQPDSELTHYHRLYRSTDVLGPWRAITSDNSKLPGLDGLFGGSIIGHDPALGSFKILGPYTENAGPEKQLQFAKPREVYPEANIANEPIKIG